MINKLKQLRLATGKTQTMVADEIPMSRSTYTNIELGKRNPSVETMKLIADYYGVTMDMAFNSAQLKRNADSDDGKLSCIFHSLNPAGKQLVIDYAEMLLSKAAYREDETDAEIKGTAY